jgi:hypothetical protein
LIYNHSIQKYDEHGGREEGREHGGYSTPVVILGTTYLLWVLETRVAPVVGDEDGKGPVDGGGRWRGTVGDMVAVRRVTERSLKLVASARRLSSVEMSASIHMH